MGRKEKDDRIEHSSSGSSRNVRKRRHRGPSASRSRSRSKSRDREYSKKVKVERDVPLEKSKDHEKEKQRDIKERERLKKVKEEKSSFKDQAEVSSSGKSQKNSLPETGTATAASSDGSLSIEETNRIRAELGLKPLDVGTDNNTSEASSKKDFVHVPAGNIGEKKATDELRRKIEEKREKRNIDKKLSRVKELGEASDDEEDNAANWVEKLRRIQQEKDEAAKRAKMLEEMDEALADGETNYSVVKGKTKAYTSKDLKGLRVEHDRETIVEGKQVVLTLKDQNILEEEGDVLVNVNLQDDERYKKNNEIKRQKPGYQPFEEDIDEMGLPKQKSLLAKYDTEIDGEKKDSFVLGRDGDEEAKKTKEAIKLKLQQQQRKFESLDSRPLQIASEYYTPDEMVSFKKVKRRVKKVRSKSDKILKADDLLQGVPEESRSSDLGSRSRQVKSEPDGDIEAPAEDLSGVKIVVDDSHPELRLALNKVKRLKENSTHTNKWKIDEIARTIKQEPLDESEPMEEDIAKNNIVLNATAEFCRTLGDIPTYGMAGNRDEDEEELLSFERQLAEERRRNQEKEERKREAERLQERGGWNVLEQDQDAAEQSMDTNSHDKDAGTVILDEEPDVGSSMAAALHLARSKGYLEKEEKKRVVISKAAQELHAQRYTIEDKAAEDDKYSRRNRFDGPVVEFKEKEGYKPQAKLEYIDDNGKPMNAKEAFRDLSHKFHGKGSGKLKSEKRAKKQEEKMLMNRMSSTDTPLNTLKKLQDKQKELQSPYVVLSGKMATTSIVKPAKSKK